MPDTKISIPNMLRICNSLSNQDFLRYFMAMKSPDNLFYLKQVFIERFGEKFLKYVKDGKQEATKAILSQCPEILGYRGNIHLQNGVITNVSALELIQEHTAILDIILSQPYDMTDEANRKEFGNALLYHAIRGNQEAVVKILRYYPELLSYRGDVVDYSDREFKQVTAFELATWALDVRHMAPAMLKCLTDNKEAKDYRRELVPELQQQFDNVVKKDGGVNYTIGCGLLKMSRDPNQLLPNETPEQRDALLNRLLNRHNGCIQYNDRIFYFHNLSCPKTLVEITDPDAINALKGLMNKEERKLGVDKSQIINNEAELEMIQKNVPNSRHIFKEKHYDFAPLLKALDRYVHSFDVGNTWALDQSDAHWCNVVGLAQHYALAQIAQHYCNPDESFDPQNNNTPPTFKEKVLKRVLTFNNWISSKTEPWWPSSGVSGSNLLGLDFGILRRGDPWASAESADEEWAWPAGAAHDFMALTALCEMRKSELPELKRLLDSLQKPDADPEPARCLVQ